MPAHGIIGQTRSSVAVETFEPIPPHGWVAQVKFSDGDELVVGHEQFYLKEMQLLSDLIMLYGFERV